MLGWREKRIGYRLIREGDINPVANNKGVKQMKLTWYFGIENNT